MLKGMLYHENTEQNVPFYKARHPLDEADGVCPVVGVVAVAQDSTIPCRARVAKTQCSADLLDLPKRSPTGASDKPDGRERLTCFRTHE